MDVEEMKRILARQKRQNQITVLCVIINILSVVLSISFVLFKKLI